MNIPWPCRNRHPK